MFPIEWVRITRAVQLQHGNFAYLPRLEMARVLVGTINDFTVAVMLGADVSRCTTREVGDLEGAAFAIGEYRFEGDIESLEKLDTMDQPYETLVICGKDVSIVARPPSNVGYVVIKVGELDEESPSKVPFAFRKWRLVRQHGRDVVELYRRG
jgi:hypothetical protein